MRLFPVLPLCTALVAAAPAGAAITAAELYAALNGLAAQADGTLSARQQASPGRLVLGDLTFTHRDGTRVILGPLTLIETPDQAVIATLPERFDLTVLPAHSLSPGVAKQVVFKVAMPGSRSRRPRSRSRLTGWSLRSPPDKAWRLRWPPPIWPCPGRPDRRRISTG